MPSDFGKDNYPKDYDPKQEESRNKTWETLAIVMITLSVACSCLYYVVEIIRSLQ